ncbi:MAG: undecaprenyl-diphosphatase UppP [Anaerolineales bacterium]|nr:undecaprenyl-diphosphatase UppP [Anaerolineales bacterium]
MTYLQSVVLGIIQGASEFLPISSSGHLVLAPYLFGWSIAPEEAFIFDVLVQVATLTAVIVYYWKDLLLILSSFFQGVIDRKPFRDYHSRLGWYLILATIPAGFAAILFKDTLEKAFSSPRAAAIFLICTSLFLLIAEIFGARLRKLESANWIDSFWIGIFQVFALFPGISRSGTTISGGMLRGFDRESSARFSFLMAVPVMLAAGVLAISDLIKSPELLEKLPVYMAGFITAAVIGYLAIRWFISFLSNKSLYIFSGYCGLVGILFLVILSV